MIDDDGTHVDLIRCFPLESRAEALQARYRSEFHADIGSQVREGWATYYYVSERHADAHCPFGAGPVVEVEIA